MLQRAINHLLLLCSNHSYHSCYQSSVKTLPSFYFFTLNFIISELISVELTYFRFFLSPTPVRLIKMKPHKLDVNAFFIEDRKHIFLYVGNLKKQAFHGMTIKAAPCCLYQSCFNLSMNPS